LFFSGNFFPETFRPVARSSFIIFRLPAFYSSGKMDALKIRIKEVRRWSFRAGGGRCRLSPLCDVSTRPVYLRAAPHRHQTALRRLNAAHHNVLN
jgi:hypothetical protein